MLQTTRPRRSRRFPVVERLEDRRLMAVTITDIPLASSTTQINGVAVYPDGNIWFTATNPAELGVYHPATNFLLEFPLNIPNSQPRGIAVGKDGNIYFTDPGINGGISSIGVFNPATLKYFEVPTPTFGSNPTGIAVANDGTVWFSESSANKVGVYDPATQKIGEFQLSGINVGVGSVTLGPDGNLWYEHVVDLESINPTTHAISSFPLDQTKTDFPYSGFSFTPDGNIWFVAQANADQFSAVEIDPTTSAVTVFPPSSEYTPNGPVPGQTAVGADGNVYYAATANPPQGPSVGEIDVANGTISTYSTGSAVLLGSIAAAPDGSLYLGGVGVLARATIVPPDVGAVTGTVTVATPPFTYPPSTTGAPIAGQTVYIDLAGTGTYAPGDPSAVTDANGNYTIPDVPLGSFNLGVFPYPGDVSSTGTVTTTGGNVVQGANLTIQPGLAILPLTFPISIVSNPDLATVETLALFGTILNRAPDPSGLVFYTTYLRGGGSLAVAAETMLHSTEYESDVVTADYKNFLGRTASSAEIAGWVNAMQNGLSAEQVAYGFMTSAEFNALHPDNASFIQALYGDVLGRTASAAEVASWSAYLGGASRASMVDFVIHSPEAGIRAAQAFYAGFWETAPDAAGETAVVNALASGLTLADLAAAFIAAPQFVARCEAETMG